MPHPAAPGPTISTMTSTDTHPAAALAHLVTEHVMRAVDDDTHLYAFLDAAPQSPAAYAALGALTTHAMFQLTAGSPVHAWLRGHTLDPNWRDAVPVRPGSLWEQLQFLQTLYGTPAGAAACPFQRLSDLRVTSRDDLGIPAF
jgi:hypothetical protein